MPAPTPQPDDEAILARRAAVEPEAFAILYDRYFPRLHKYMLYRVHEPQTADDLVSQVFEQALRDLCSYQPDRAPFGAWLFGIARHVVGDHFRALKRQRWLSIDGLRHLAGDGPPFEEQAIQSEMGDRLLAALKRLPDRDRDLIGLKFAAGLNNRQIARLNGLGESNVGVILYRAMQRLRAELVEEEQDND